MPYCRMFSVGLECENGGIRMVAKDFSFFCGSDGNEGNEGTVRGRDGERDS
jgi:hypothetical protein